MEIQVLRIFSTRCHYNILLHCVVKLSSNTLNDVSHGCVSPQEDFGQTDFEQNSTQLVLTWYRFLVAEHFTQVVWKGTRYVGMGMAHNVKRGIVVIVANYFPPGNVIGHFVENVLKPKRIT